MQKWSVLSLILVFSVAGCANRAPVTLSAEAPSLSVFECERLSFSFYYKGPDEARLYLPEGPVEVKPVRAASGARFAGDGVEFWNKGEQARLDWPGGHESGCRLNAARAPRDSLGRYPVEFRALGNEPGWLLELSADEARLLTDYGQVRTVTPLPAAERVGPGVSYRIETEATDLNLHFEPERCQDSMSGEAFGWTALVDLNGESFVGCGEALVEPWPGG